MDISINEKITKSEIEAKKRSQEDIKPGHKHNGSYNNPLDRKNTPMKGVDERGIVLEEVVAPKVRGDPVFVPNNTHDDDISTDTSDAWIQAQVDVQEWEVQNNIKLR